ncbi:MerR family transcriptional regulator [Streptantibioticus ferralitis]|uniref:MerR family transcriptional regulator n=1 Tax=Streptantibioticus ferralitis TaxID=236510 RepID=A0ABT5ZA10_9ACTN|nr:MerR family transcriptional regulator [Streptantibioticus ferralitis]MDF2260684.1 MerR family transcriptional regulator [Streptantibioticus ferralitis]
MSYSVGQVATLAGVTVRTLHHYDEIGLLTASGRSHAGHRRYEDVDLDRLQQILFYRELGFPLEEIAVLVSDPEADPAEHLRRQYSVLTDRIARLRQMAAAVERAMEARKLGINLTPEEKFEVFGPDYDPDDYAEEVEQRWGHTEAYRQSQRRAATYTKEDWLRINADAADINAKIAALMETGAAPQSEEAMDLAEEHRQHICRFFYDCPYQIHTGLGGMYVADERFKGNYEAIKPGMAAFLRDAIMANAARSA